MHTQLKHFTFTNLDCEIHYWHKAGSGNTYVLFFHGAGIDHRMFESQIELFDDTYNLVFWDARGHGKSKLRSGVSFSFEDMVSDCLKLYDVLNISSAILIGHSMGGNLAQEITYRNPDIVEKLVLIDCTINSGKLTSAERLALGMSQMALSFCPWELLAAQSADACSAEEHVRKYVLECFGHINKQIFYEAIMSLTECMHDNHGYRFMRPVLMLCGTDDYLGNIKSVMERWALADDSCTLHMIEHARHNPNQDKPDIVNSHIAEFLKG